MRPRPWWQTPAGPRWSYTSPQNELENRLNRLAGVPAGRDLRDAGQPGDRHRREALQRGEAAAELAVLIGSPGFDGAVGQQCHGVTGTGRELGNPAARPDRQDRPRLGILAVVTEVAVSAVAPSPDGPVGAQYHRVLRAGRDALDITDVEAGYHLRSGLAAPAGGAVPDRCVGVLAPGQDLVQDGVQIPVLHGHPEEGSGRDRRHPRQSRDRSE